MEVNDKPLTIVLRIVLWAASTKDLHRIRKPRRHVDWMSGIQGSDQATEGPSCGKIGPLPEYRKGITVKRKFSRDVQHMIRKAVTCPQTIRQTFLFGAVVLMVAIGCDIGSNSKKSDSELMKEKMDRHKARAAQAQQQLLNARGVEIVKGSIHGASDPSRQCQRDGNSTTTFTGSTSVSLPNGKSVKVSIVDCHPCNWPPAPQQDMTCSATLLIECSLKEPVLIEFCIGGGGKDGKGEFTICLPKDQTKRAIVVTMIKGVAGTKAAPTRADFNRVLRQGFGLIKSANRNQAIAEFVTILCKAVSIDLNKKLSTERDRFDSTRNSI